MYKYYNDNNELINNIINDIKGKKEHTPFFHILWLYCFPLLLLEGLKI